MIGINLDDRTEAESTIFRLFARSLRHISAAQ